jgi:hypothetical protein
MDNIANKPSETTCKAFSILLDDSDMEQATYCVRRRSKLFSVNSEEDDGNLSTADSTNIRRSTVGRPIATRTTFAQQIPMNIVFLGQWARIPIHF